MSFTANSDTDSAPAYQRQTTSYRRTRAAILESAKRSLEVQGFAATSMIDIADTAEVSRATLYNHFRDKGSVFRALCEFEIARIFSLARSAPNQSDALIELARAVAGDGALARLRVSDPALVTIILSNQEDPLWAVIRAEMDGLFAESADTWLTWLIGQALTPTEIEAISAHVAIVTGHVSA